MVITLASNHRTAKDCNVRAAKDCNVRNVRLTLEFSIEHPYDER
jgi:hypothetical protein